jgi:GxxExxY protein
MREEDVISESVIGSAIEVHRSLGPGLLESVYEECLAHELALRNIPFRRQLPVPVIYKGVTLDCGFRLDLFVSDRLVVELKAVDRVLPVHVAQALTYLRLTHCKLGLILNFNAAPLTAGIKRVVLNY